jgi:hypothetical protein
LFGNDEGRWDRNLRASRTDYRTDYLCKTSGRHRQIIKTYWQNHARSRSENTDIFWERSATSIEKIPSGDPNVVVTVRRQSEALCLANAISECLARPWSYLTIESLNPYNKKEGDNR